MRNAWLFCLILGTARHASAQSSSLALLRMDSTPATLALGPAGAYLTGTHAIGVNPASLPTERYEVFAQHQSGLAQTTLQSVRGVFPLPRLRAALGVSFLRLDSRGLEGRTELGQPTGSFRQSDAVLGLHGSLALPFDRADAFHLGAGVKRLTSELAGRSAATLAFDGGLTYRREALSLGLSLLNVGKGLTYLAEASPLPRTLVISGAYRLAAPFTVMASVSRLHVERATELTLGTQYWFMDAIALRFRYTGSSALGGNGLGGAAGGLG
ncbi:MAG: hypothetical protein HY553_07395, partial [Elusimicrobia bacterium]|nr:hypothetical protein [Elusimicrobiota bacterium]